jgi:hypothetical protein
METKLNIYQKLLTIQKKINGLGKDKKSFTYSYVTGDKVLGEIKPMMNELGLILKQEILSIENTRQDYATKTGTKSEILSKVEMRFTWIDCATGETDVNLFGANGQNDWEKGLGSALTYAERYFLLKYFHIATDEDDIDNDQRKGVEPKIEPNTHFSNQTTPPSTTATNLPPLSDKAFAAMLDAIAKGDKDKVKAAMTKYTLLKPQLDELNKLLN